jgi:hypothetical protein
MSRPKPRPLPLTHFEAHCGDKERYATQEQAEKKARLLFRTKGRLLEAYLCRYGGHWHLGRYDARDTISAVRGMRILRGDRC